jgi:hypothetical protein
MIEEIIVIEVEIVHHEEIIAMMTETIVVIEIMIVTAENHLNQKEVVEDHLIEESVKEKVKD